MTVQANQGFGVTVFTTGADSGGGGSTTPGGGTGTIQYNNAGAFAGAAGVTTNGTTLTVSGSSASDMMRITQTGAGNALVVEDSANPDSSPFVIDAAGKIIKGATAPLTNLAFSLLTGRAPSTQIIGGVNSDDPVMAVVANLTTATGAGTVVLAKSRGTSASPTVIVSGDRSGTIAFDGYDGADYVNGAEIFSAVDGTPGTDNMPGRLVFATTPSGASTPTERMRIDSVGAVGIGTTTLIGRNLNVSKNITGAVTSYCAQFGGAVQSDVTGNIYYVATSASTASASFTAGSLYHYLANQSTFGAGSFVTTQFGFGAAATLTGASNNYGFSGNIAAGVSRTITTVDRTSNVVTITTSVAHGYLAGQSVTVAATTNTGVNGTFVITTVPTTATFTYAQVGADIPSGADTGTTVIVGRYNAYMSGTAPNYFNGSVGIGTLTGLNKLDINGSLGRGAPVTKTGNFTLAATENWIIVNNASANTTVTLPAAFLWTGRELMMKNLSATYTVISASSNVVPVDGTTAGTAILAAGAGKSTTLVSDGTNWVTMRSSG